MTGDDRAPRSGATRPRGNPFFRERGRADYISWTRSEDGAAAFKLLRSRLPRRAE